MKKFLKWIGGIAIVLVFLGLVAAAFAIGQIWRFRNIGMMDGRGLDLFNRSHMFISPFGWLGMGLGWLLQAGIIILVIIGLVSLFNNLTRANRPPVAPPPPPPAPILCANCGKYSQPDWQHCPYCGQALAQTPPPPPPPTQ